MSTPHWGPDFDALAGMKEIGTAIRDGGRTAEAAAGVRELVGAHPAHPEPARSA